MDVTDFTLISDFLNKRNLHYLSLSGREQFASQGHALTRSEQDKTLPAFWISMWGETLETRT